MNMDEEKAPTATIKIGKFPLQRPSRRCVYIIVIVCVLCLFLCIVLASTLSRKSGDHCPSGIHCDWRSMNPSKFMQDERCEPVCTSKPCLRSAEFALSRIDVNKDPCEDFYEFSCGKFEEEAVLFPDTNSAALTYHEMENELMLKLKEMLDSIPEKVIGTVSDYLLLARKFYDDCINTDHHVDALDRNAMGILVGDDGVMEWPLLNQSIANNDEQLARIMSTSLFYGANPFFSLDYVGESGQKEDRNHKLIFHFNGVDTEQVRNLLTEPLEHQDDNDLYQRYTLIIDQILRGSGVNASDITRVSTEVRQLEKSFKEGAMEALGLDLGEKIRGYYDVPRFAKYDCRGSEFLMRSLKWCRIVELLLEEMERPKDSKVELRFFGAIDFYEEVNKVLLAVSDRVVINYVVVKFIMNHLEYMPAPLRQMYYDNPEIFPPENKFRPLTTRWQQCIDVVSSFFGIRLELEYIEEKLLDSDKNRANMVLEKMKEVYVSVINRVPWTDEKSKEFLTKQMQFLKLVLGNSGMWESEEGTFTIELFAKVTRYRGTGISFLHDPRQTLIKDVLGLKKLFRTRSHGSDSMRSMMTQQPFKLFPDRMGHNIRILHGMLQFPMFLQGRPMYIEFATFGKHVLTEISRNYILSQLSENSTKVLDSYLKCFDDQMGINQTRGASKADELKRIYGNFHNTLGALASTEVYLKYLKDNGQEKGLPGLPFSNEQLFFISLAQMNCETFTGKRYKHYPAEYFMPSKERVNTPLANSEAFSKAFRCPSGSKMNPVKKCCVLGNEKSSEKCR